MAHSNARQSIAPDPETQGAPPTGPRLVSSSPDSRASNAARAALVVANVTPTGYNVGIFMANHARYAKTSDIRRNVAPGEIFTFWPQAKIAAELGCSERQVSRGVRSLREAGVLEVRRRVRPCEASYVWVQPVGSGVVSAVGSDGACVGSGVGSGVVSGVGSHTEPRTEPKKNHVRSSSRARVVCPKCGHDFPSGYGRKCHKCNHDPSKGKPTPDEPTACTCGDAYRNCYAGKCLDCKGVPSAAQRDAVQPAQTAAPPPPAETETRPPPEDTEPGPEQRRFKAALARWTDKRRRRRPTAWDTLRAHARRLASFGVAGPCLTRVGPMFTGVSKRPPMGRLPPNQDTDCR